MNTCTVCETYKLGMCLITWKLGERENESERE